jgi:hypothetical protein
LIIQYGRAPIELKYKVVDLIEMLINGIEYIDDDIVTWSAKHLLQFLNSHNIGLHEVPSSFAVDTAGDAHSVSSTTTISPTRVFDSFHIHLDSNCNRRFSL